jgi:uncharacterized protein
MKLENTFSIPVPVADAWRVLLDLERIAPCVPGATLTSRDGDEYHGKIKVRLGPISLTYNGIIKIAFLDEAAGIAVLEGGGRETRGNGTAKATITCRLVDAGDGTDVVVDTDLAITGKPAQFGRGTLAEVAGTLIGQFATNLAAEIASTTGTDMTPEPAALPEAENNSADRGESNARSAPSSGPRHAASATSSEPIDLLDAAGIGGLTRLAPAAVTIVLLTFLLFLLRRYRQKSGETG